MYLTINKPKQNTILRLVKESTMLTAQKLFPYTKLHADLCIVNQQTHQTKQKYMDL